MSEAKSFVIWNEEYGYYTGEFLEDDGVVYLPYCMFKTDASVKVYKSEKRAINMGEKLIKKCTYFNDYKILPY